MTKEIIAINTTADGCAFTVCARYGAACARNLLGGGTTTLCPQSRKSSVRILGSFSPTSAIGGRVIDPYGIAPTLMAGTHGYGFGCVLLEE